MSRKPITPNSFISPSFSNIVHPSVDFDTAQWLGPFKVVINTKGLDHQALLNDETVNSYDEHADVLATLNTLANLAIPSGSIIEIGATNDLKGRSSRIDAITAGNLFASVLTSPESIPRLAAMDDEDVIAPVHSSMNSCATPMNLLYNNQNTFPNLLSDNTLYISPQIAAQIGFTPTDYAHIPLDQLICNDHSHTCSHPTQFKKTQTDFAQHRHNEEFSEDCILSLNFPLEKHIYIRVAQLPRPPPKNSSNDQFAPSIPRSLRLDHSIRELRLAQRAVFYLLPSLNNFPPNVVHDILFRYFTTPLKHQVNPLFCGRQLHVGTVFAVPITIQEEDRLYHQSIEEKAEDHDEENLKCVPAAYFPTDCLYFYCAMLECDKNIYTAIDENHNPLYENEQMPSNAGHHNNFLTCKLTRSVSPSIQDARALIGLDNLTPHQIDNPVRQHQYSSQESIDVHRTTSYMQIDGAQTQFTVHSFNLTCLRPSLFQHVYSSIVTNQSNYIHLLHLALKHALLKSPQFQTSLLHLIHKHPTLLFNIPILDTILLRGYGPAFSSLFDSILPSFYSPHTFILPLIQSSHTKNSKATLLRALSYLLHLDYIEIDTDQAEGLIPESDIQYASSAMSAVINIRNIGIDTVIPPLPSRHPGIVNNIYFLTASCIDTPKHVLATDVINLPLPSPTPRSRMYMYEFLTRMTFNSTANPSQSKLKNDISCHQLSAMMVCSYVALTGYTNAPTQSVSLLAQATLVKSINSFKTDKELYITCLQKQQDALLTCHCNVLCNLLQHNNVASGIPNVSWKDIGAAGQIRKELMQLIKPKTGSTTTEALGNAFSLQRRGVLLYGPPGSGKTLVAKALAGESGIGFVTANAGEILSMYIGESEKKIRELFINARNSAPCVLFLDEIDSLAPSKNNAGNSGGGGVMQRIVSQLLLEIDSLNDDGIDVFLVGATNRPELLDLSLLRPGRLDRSIYVGISETVDDQLQILKALSRKFTLGPKVNLRKIIESYCINRPLTGADFFALASTSMTLAIMDAVNNVEREKQGEIIDHDADDYDVEDDPDPLVPKSSAVKQIGDINSFANSDLINKTLTATNLTTASTSSTTLPSMSCGPTVSNDLLPFSETSIDSTFTSKKSVKRDLFNFGKSESTTPISNKNDQSVLNLNTQCPPSSLTPSQPPITTNRKKKQSKVDGILDFGGSGVVIQTNEIPINSTNQLNDEPAPTNDARPITPTVDTQVTSHEPNISNNHENATTVPSKPKKNRKKIDPMADLFSGMSFTPAATELPSASQTEITSTEPHLQQPNIQSELLPEAAITTTPTQSTTPTSEMLNDPLAQSSQPKRRKNKKSGMDLFDIPGLSFTPVLDAQVSSIENVSTNIDPTPSSLDVNPSIDEDKPQQQPSDDNEENSQTQPTDEPQQPFSDEIKPIVPSNNINETQLSQSPTSHEEISQTSTNIEPINQEPELESDPFISNPADDNKPSTTQCAPDSSNIIVELVNDLPDVGKTPQNVPIKLSKKAKSVRNKLLSHLFNNNTIKTKMQHLSKGTKSTSKTSRPRNMLKNHQQDEDDELQDEDDELQDEDDELQDEDDQPSDDEDLYIPAPSYGGIQLQLLLGLTDSKSFEVNQTTQIDPTESFKFSDESEESELDDYQSDSEDVNPYEQYEEYKDDYEQDEDDEPDFFQQHFILQQDLEEIEAQKREEISQSVASRGVIVYQKHFIQAAKKLTPSLSKDELDHYRKIREQFSSKRQKKLA